MIAQFPLYATAFLILFARVGAVLMMLPVFSDDGVVPRVRLLVAGGMTLGLWGLLSPAALPLAGADTGTLAGVLIAELLTGLAIGMIVRMMFQAIAIAGALISMQVGLSTASLFDPAQGGMAPTMSRYITLAATVVCMALDVHHLWLAALVRSYTAFPIGHLPQAQDFAEMAVRTADQAMLLGLGLAAPLVVYGIVFNIVLGLAQRMAPGIQVFFVAQPLNLLLGITITAGLLGAMLTGFANSFADWMQAGWS
ncbi:MAG: flagellar biosynthetic protein FliR [Sphingomonas sp.]